MIRCLRRPVGKELVDAVVELVHNGESSVLLAPVFGGKHQILRSLRERLIAENTAPLIWFSVGGSPVAEDGTLALKACIDGVIESRVEEPVGLADAVEVTTRKPVVILADGIDRMGESRARRFLMQVRTRVAARKLIVVLAGERNFRDLLHGPNSEFNCANQFVLQGYDMEMFRERWRECWPPWPSAGPTRSALSSTSTAKPAATDTFCGCSCTESSTFGPGATARAGKWISISRWIRRSSIGTAPPS